MAFEQLVPLHGSEKEMPRYAVGNVAAIDPTEQVTVTVILNALDEFDYSPETLRVFAAVKGLTVLPNEPHHPAWRVALTGTAERMQEAFGVTLRRFQPENGPSHRLRTGTIMIPQELDGAITAVLGLDDRPQAWPHFRPAANPDAPLAASAVAAAYQYPTDADGTGQCVALIELGGGYQPSDVTAYSQQSSLPAPHVTAVGVDGASNSPGQDADMEVVLDIDVVLGTAPGARIGVYFAPNTDAGFVDAILAAVHDPTNKPAVISISWGAPEADWTGQARAAMDQAFQAAIAAGINVFVASGDNGSSDGLTGNNADYPASSPYVTGVGGTRMDLNPLTETVWNSGVGQGAGGGGYSSVYQRPSWQTGITNPMRGVPDVCADADPATGYTIFLNGRWTVVGGTSGAAPCWAGCCARLNQKAQGKLGFINPQLYAHPAVLRDITAGNNGAWSAAPGWDAASGLGSPNGIAMEQQLISAPAQPTPVKPPAQHWTPTPGDVGTPYVQALLADPTSVLTSGPLDQLLSLIEEYGGQMFDPTTPMGSLLALFLKYPSIFPPSGNPAYASFGQLLNFLASNEQYTQEVFDPPPGGLGWGAWADQSGVA